MFGLGVNRLGATNQKPFSPASLFNNGEAGVWYDPSAASGSLGWRKNLLEYTESFDNSYWTYSRISAVLSTVKPDDVLGSTLFTPNSVYNAHNLEVALVAGNRYTVSIYAKSNGYNYLGISNAGSPTNTTTFNLSTGQVHNTGADIDSAVMLDVGNGWYRCSMTWSAPYNSIRFYIASTSQFNNHYSGDGTSGMYFTGAQLEEASTASSYQPILSTFANAFKAAFPSHTLYQDSNGVTPVTAVGEPVGLMLDKSEGLAQGPELVTNGDFSNGTTGWNFITETPESGSARLNNTSLGNNTYYNQNAVGEVGKVYVLTYDVLATNGATLALQQATNLLLDTATTGSKRLTFNWSRVGGTLTFKRVTPNTDVTIDNISVKEIQGSHATQPTSTKRPIYARHPEGGIRNLLNYTEQFDNGYLGQGQRDSAS